MKNIIIILVCIFLLGCENPIGIDREEEDIILEPERIYTCNINDSLNNNNLCVHETVYNALIRYNCPVGYISYGSICKKSGGIFNASKCGWNAVEYLGMCYTNINATIEYYCFYGSRMEGNSCITEETYRPAIKYKCQDGYFLTSDNKCKKSKEN